MGQYLSSILDVKVNSAIRMLTKRDLPIPAPVETPDFIGHVLSYWEADIIAQYMDFGTYKGNGSITDKQLYWEHREFCLLQELVIKRINDANSEAGYRGMNAEQKRAFQVVFI